MSNVRVEYLFPYIENKRKLKWLETASFFRAVEDHKVVDFSLEEYLYRYRREKVQYIDNHNRNITAEVNQENYEKWKTRSQSNLFNLDGDSICFDNDMVVFLAQYLYNHPLEIPYFLEQNAINIIGLFLGQSILFTDMNLAPSFHNREYELCHKQVLSEDDYLRKNFEAKYKLSLFLGVIDELLKMGVNLEEFSFVDLRDCSTYQDIKKTPLWNQKLIETMNVSNYRRLDGQTFSKEEMLKFIQFSTLSEFLSCIINLVEVEYYASFIEEAVTMNPSDIVVLPYHSKDFSFIPSDDLVNVNDLCVSFQKKLKQVAMESEIKILERKLEELRKLLYDDKMGTNIDETELCKQIELLYQEIEKITAEKRNQLIAVLKQILESRNLDSLIPNKKEENEEFQNSSKDDSNPIENEVKKLNLRVEDLEKRVNILETILREYFDNGGIIPNLDNINMPREEVIKLIQEYRPTTIGAFFRKIELLKKLKVGLFAALMGGMLFISGSTETTLKEMGSTSLTLNLSEQVVDFVKPKIPIKTIEAFNSSDISSVSPEASITEVSSLRPIEEIVFEVIRGNWGNGKDRKLALEQEGYDFEYVQNFVNKVIQENVPINKLRSLEEVAIEVVSGIWGEGDEALLRLTKVGFDYQLIQQIIPEMDMTIPKTTIPQK